MRGDLKTVWLSELLEEVILTKGGRENFERSRIVTLLPSVECYLWLSLYCTGLQLVQGDGFIVSSSFVHKF